MESETIITFLKAVGVAVILLSIHCFFLKRDKDKIRRHIEQLGGMVIGIQHPLFVGDGEKVKYTVDYIDPNENVHSAKVIFKGSEVVITTDWITKKGSNKIKG